ncbi:MAG: VOC family protein [Gemmatimonadaceae bacterium]|jgi:catechol 2,3-dioxygenase-like lactoylglutathione lyase family enzyme|nr:VOC family protein [Gemmatimonadaceae bacterium]
MRYRTHITRLSVALLGCAGSLTAQPAPAPPLLDLYPLITTPRLADARDFYVAELGFTVVFDSSWFVMLTAPGSRAATIAFLAPDHPSRVPGPDAFSGAGMLLTLQVADARAACRRLQSRGARLVHPVTDEQWGQRRCALRDPAGVLLDIVQQTEAAPGYWERYPPRRVRR